MNQAGNVYLLDGLYFEDCSDMGGEYVGRQYSDFHIMISGVKEKGSTDFRLPSNEYGVFAYTVDFDEEGRELECGYFEASSFLDYMKKVMPLINRI